MKTIQDIKPTDKELNTIFNQYKYQEELTPKLDELDSDFNQDTVNEIVLWKVNRYAKMKKSTLELLNQINKNIQSFDIDLTQKILSELLETKGIRLAMASTILRFKNPFIYQIFDQRVYRQVYQENYKSTTKIEKQIQLYIKYLDDLRLLCQKYKIKFQDADRVLYQFDIETNDEKIRY